jgi:hypothetical protein
LINPVAVITELGAEDFLSESKQIVLILSQLQGWNCFTKTEWFLLEEFEPTLWLAGCFFDHAHPRGFTWIQTIDQSVVFNVSQTSIGAVFREAAFPNHIVFDLKSGRTQWNSWLQAENEERVLELRWGFKNRPISDPCQKQSAKHCDKSAEQSGRSALPNP